MADRVVITGMGVVSPNAIGVDDFRQAIAAGRSGIRFLPELRELNFRCQVGGVPPLDEQQKEERLGKFGLSGLRSTGVIYGCIAGIEAWMDASLPIGTDSYDRRSGCIMGTGSNGIEAIDYGIRIVDQNNMRELDGSVIQQGMNSAVSSFLGGTLGLGNRVTTNASACSTGTEAVLEAYYLIKAGIADRILAGSCESNSPYVWGPFDSLFALAQGYNDTPQKASQPLSANATGFVPSSGAGALVIESLASARKRDARIYAEILGGNTNSGGQRGNGTMTIGNADGMIRCISQALSSSGIGPNHIDLISGHLTSTIGDINEITSWVKALKRGGADFPWINATKSMIGHCLSASGSIEMIASVLQLHHDFIHPSLNSEDMHPEIEKLIHPARVPLKTRFSEKINVAAKISFGFGDVNACVILKKWNR